VNKLAYISFLLLCLGQVHIFSWLYFSLLVVSWTIYLVVTCEGEIYLCLTFLCLLKTPGHQGHLPWALLSKQKEPSYRGDIGQDWFSYASLPLQSLAFILTTNCAITRPLVQRNQATGFKLTQPTPFVLKLSQFSHYKALQSSILTIK
jgi:hypothetical protein